MVHVKIIIAAVFVWALYMIYNFIHKRYWSKNLFIDLKFENDICVSGEENSLIETVTNKKALPISILRVRFYVSKYLDFGNRQNVSVSDKSYKNDIFSAMFFSKITRKIDFVCRRRGFYDIDKIEIVSYNLFLRSPLTKTAKCSASLTVLPKAVQKKKIDAIYNNIYGDICVKHAPLADPFEFKGIRKYETYDSIRDINWKASAKSDELMVNVHDFTTSKEVILLLNVSGDNEFTDDRLVEYCISIVSGFAVRFVKSGIPVGFLTNASDVITKSEINILPAAGDMHALSIRRALARCDAKNAKDMCEYISTLPKKRGAMYVIVSCASKKELLKKAGELAKEGGGAFFVNVYKKGEDKAVKQNGCLNVYNWEMENSEGI